MSRQYCTGKSKGTTLGVMDNGVKTCTKARSVFYATMKKQGISYTEVRQEDVEKLDSIVSWYRKKVKKE